VGHPALRIHGVIQAQYVGQFLSITLSVLLIGHWLKKHAAANTGDKCA